MEVLPSLRKRWVGSGRSCPSSQARTGPPAPGLPCDLMQKIRKDQAVPTYISGQATTVSRSTKDPEPSK